MWNIPFNGPDGRFLSRHHCILGSPRLRHFDIGPSPIDFGFRGRRGADIVNQQIIYEAPRRSVWGNIADALWGVTQGLSMFQWWGQQSAYSQYQMNMYPYQQYPMYPTYPVQQQTTTTTTTSTSTQTYKNLQTIGETTGYSKIVDNQDGTYTVINPDTKDYITGTYDEIQEKTLKHKEDVEEAEPAEDPTDASVDEEPEVSDEDPVPQGAHTDKSVVKATDLTKFKGPIVVTDDVRVAKYGAEKTNVSGETTYSDDKTNGYPNTMTIGGYNYALQTPVKADQVMYVSQDGDGQSYRLEWRDNKVILVQHKGDEGAGDADIH